MIYVDFTIGGTRTVDVEPDDLMNEFPETIGKTEEELVAWLQDNIDTNDELLDWVVSGDDGNLEYDTESFDYVWSN